MKKNDKNSLSMRMLRHALWGLLGGLIVFAALANFSSRVLRDYFSGSTYLSHAFDEYLEDFQRYVTENNVSAEDCLAIRRWAHHKHFAHFIIVREEEYRRYLLYDDSFDASVILDRAYSETDSINWMHFRPVQFSDGEALVFIDKGYSLSFYIIDYLCCAIVSAMVWTLIFLFGVRREMRSIQNLNKVIQELGKGEMDAEIKAVGSTEMVNLANGLDRMRNEILEKEKTEEVMRDAQEKLLLGMAHDLRNPLTGLIGFLETLKDEPLSSDGQTHLNRAFVQTDRIRNLAEQLFEYFLIHSAPVVDLEEPEGIGEALEDYLSEMASVLEQNGFMVLAEHLSWPDGLLRVNHNYMGRIFQNLTDNMKKYAEPQKPVIFSGELQGSKYVLCIKNTIRLNAETTVKGTKIGVKNVIGMMENMGAECCIIEDDQTYETRMDFPLWDTSV